MEEVEYKVETTKEYYDRFRKALDPVTVDTLAKGNFNDEYMCNFIFGLDLLKEITETVYFKSGQPLETPDTLACKSDAHRMFNSPRFNKGAIKNKIKDIRYPTTALIVEFFKGGYFELYYTMMAHIHDNRLMVSLHGKKYFIRLEPKAPHPMYGILEYVDVEKKQLLKLPFFIHRLSNPYHKSLVN